MLTVFCQSRLVVVTLALSGTSITAVAQDSQPRPASAPAESAATAPASASSALKYAVLPAAVTAGISADTARLLDELFLTELQKHAGADDRILGASDFGAMLDLEQQKQLMGCANDSCMAEIGLALGVDRLIQLSLGQLGDKHAVVLKVIDPHEVRVLLRESATVEGGEEALLQAVNALAPRVFGKQADVVVTRTSASSDATTEANSEQGGGLGALGWAGAGVAALGVAGLVASGVGVTLSDLTLGDPASTGGAKEAASTGYVVSLVGAGVGLVVLAGGGTLLLLGLE